MLKLAEYHSKENASNISVDNVSVVPFWFFFSFKILFCIQSNWNIDRDAGTAGHRVIYGVESWNGVVEWSGVEFGVEWSLL